MPIFFEQPQSTLLFLPLCPEGFQQLDNYSYRPSKEIILLHGAAWTGMTLGVFGTCLKKWCVQSEYDLVRESISYGMGRVGWFEASRFLWNSNSYYWNMQINLWCRYPISSPFSGCTVSSWGSPCSPSNGNPSWCQFILRWVRKYPGWVTRNSP